MNHDNYFQGLFCCVVTKFEMNKFAKIHLVKLVKLIINTKDEFYKKKKKKKMKHIFLVFHKVSFTVNLRLSFQEIHVQLNKS